MRNSTCLRVRTVVFLLAGLVVGLALTVQAAELRAQEGERGRAGVSFLVGVPLGDFDDFIDASPGISFFGQYNVDRRGIFGLRVDGSVVIYGSETTQRPLSLTVQRVQVDVTTQNTILSLMFGPQFTVPGGPLRPYANIAIGFSYFSTTSSVKGTSDERDFASSTNFEDGTFAWAAGGGLLIRLSRKVSIDLSGRYLGNGQVRYLREGSIIESASGSISFTPIESETDLLLLQVGVSLSIGKGGEDDQGAANNM